MSVIRRWLIPVMADDAIAGRERRHGLTPEDFEIVLAGFACPRCLACWEGDTRRMVCPACGHERSDRDFEDVIEEWEAYRAYVKGEMENPTRTYVPKAHEVMEEIARANGVKPTYDRGIQRR